VSDDGLAFDAPRDLPPLAGGWILHEAAYGGVGVRLWIPRAPDALLDDDEVIERNRFNDSMPYWAWLWDSAPRLARLVAAAGWPPGTRVLELGAGLGLVGLVAARLGCEVTLSDHDPLALATLRVNVREATPSRGSAVASLTDSCGSDSSPTRDSTRPPPRVIDLDWRALEALGQPEFDVVLGCDVLYEAGSHEPVLDVLERCLTSRGEAWLADPGRTRLPAFMRRAEARGWSVAVLDEDGHSARVEPGAFRALRLRPSPPPSDSLVDRSIHITETPRSARP